MAVRVGDAVAAALVAQGDHALSDSQFGTNSDGSQWERCSGLKADYLASNASGNWEVRVHFFAEPPAQGG